MASKRLVYITCILFLLILLLFCYANASVTPTAVQIEHEGNPTLGYPRAKVHVVVFEEPKCHNCFLFNKLFFPKLKENFIDKNKITYTMIPVSFLPGSSAAADALLCVYHNDATYPNDQLFFTYLDYMLGNQPKEHSDWVTTEKLLDMAKAASPAIDLAKLERCIETQTYRKDIEKNTAFGSRIMGGVLATPTVFVNGVQIKELEYEKIEALIKKSLGQEGVRK